METVTRNVKDIGTADRQVLEHVIGRRLAENQQIVINVRSLDVATPAPSADTQETDKTDEIPPWWKVYEGLGDAEVDRLDQAIRQRANLTRAAE